MPQLFLTAQTCKDKKVKKLIPLSSQTNKWRILDLRQSATNTLLSHIYGWICMKLYLPSCSSFTLWLLILHYIFVKRLINSAFTISRPVSLKNGFFASVLQAVCWADPVSPPPAGQRCSSGGHRGTGGSPRWHWLLWLFIPPWAFPKHVQVISNLSPSEMSK